MLIQHVNLHIAAVLWIVQFNAVELLMCALISRSYLIYPFSACFGNKVTFALPNGRHSNLEILNKNKFKFSLQWKLANLDLVLNFFRVESSSRFCTTESVDRNLSSMLNLNFIGWSSSFFQTKAPLAGPPSLARSCMNRPAFNLFASSQNFWLKSFEYTKFF